MIKLFEEFSKPIFSPYNRKKPEIDEKTIRVEDKNKNWYIDFYFDEKDRLDYVDNKWNIRVPDWYGLSANFITIKIWAKKYDPNCNIFYIIQNTGDKYNL